jgi:hypothetical protein
MMGNFTEGQTIKVPEEISELESNFGLDRMQMSTKRQNFFLNDTNGKN